MSTNSSPRIGQWYRHLDKGESFLVIGYDERTGTAEIQTSMVIWMRSIRSRGTNCASHPLSLFMRFRIVVADASEAATTWGGSVIGCVP